MTLGGLPPSHNRSVADAYLHLVPKAGGQGLGWAGLYQTLQLGRSPHVNVAKGNTTQRDG